MLKEAVPKIKYSCAIIGTPDLKRLACIIFFLIVYTITENKCRSICKSVDFFLTAYAKMFLVIRFQILARTETGGGPEGPPFYTL